MKNHPHFHTTSREKELQHKIKLAFSSSSIQRRRLVLLVVYIVLPYRQLRSRSILRPKQCFYLSCSTCLSQTSVAFSLGPTTSFMQRPNPSYQIEGKRLTTQATSAWLTYPHRKLSKYFAWTVHVTRGRIMHYLLVT